MLISDTAPMLIRAIQDEQSVEITAKGTWRHKSLLLRIVNLFRRIILGYNEALENAQNLAAFLAVPKMVSSEDIKRLSQKDSWDADAMSALVKTVKKTLLRSVRNEKDRILSLIYQRDRMKDFPNEAKRVEVVELNRKISSVKEWPSRYATACLDQAFLTQKYLGENQKNIEATKAAEEDMAWLKKKLVKWSKNQYPAIDYGPDYSGALATIRRACQYRDFIAAARKNKALLELFLSSVFKNQSNIDVFIQAPALQTELEKAFLYKRLQRSANGGLVFRQTSDDGGKPVKDVTLLISGKRQSIVDPSGMVRIAKKVRWTVSKVFEECKAQNNRFIDLEYLWKRGLTKFDVRLSRFNLDQEEWWTHLPTMFQPMTKEEILAAYGVCLDGNEKYALFVARGSRTVPDTSIEGCHGWCNIIFPSNDGRYTVIAPGKYADWFPNSLREKGVHTFGTFRGQVTLADFNEFISHRERISVPVSCLTKEEFLKAMAFLKTKLIESREGNMVFQAQGDDCANFVQELSDHLRPGKFNLFDLRFEEVVVPTPLNLVVQIKPLFPTEEGWQRFRRIFCCLFGGSTIYRMKNGTVVRLKDFQKWHDGILALPAALWRHRDDILEKFRASLTA